MLTSLLAAVAARAQHTDHDALDQPGLAAQIDLDGCELGIGGLERNRKPLRR